MDLELKTALDGIRSGVKEFAPKLEALEQKTDALQRQCDAIDVASAGHRGGGGDQVKSIAAEIFENEDFKHLAEMGGRGRVTIKIDDFRKKTLTGTAAGISTSGVLTIDRSPDIVGVQFRQLRIRDLLRSAPTSEAACDYVKVSAFDNQASPQVEASAKAQSDMTLTSVVAPVRTVAHWIRASKQILSDLPGLTEAINSHLLYGLKLIEETQILSGDGTGQNLLGLIPQATAFSTGLLVAARGWNSLDIIARAIQQAERTNYTVDAIVLNTDDFWSMAVIRDGFGRFLFGDPSAATIPRLWGRPVAVTNSLTSGTFLVGSSATALIRDRLEAIVEVSENVGTDFLNNMVVIRAEERLCLQVMRPGAWITGVFTSSPA
jgi:HK97 family phage major capsid protein